jgi:hypothetical protein
LFDAITGGSYMLTWPVKKALTGQTFKDAWKLLLTQTPKGFIKSISCSYSRNHVAGILR